MSQVQERRPTGPYLSGRRVAVAALLYARIGEEVELVSYRPGLDGWEAVLVSGVLEGCSGTEWILDVEGNVTRYPFTKWEYCIGATDR